MTIDQQPANPPGNVLGPNIDTANFLAALEESGYPLQGVVTEALTHRFVPTEEWGYIDRDTGSHRSLDIFAFRNLSSDESSGPVLPSLVLLVECKRSDLPYVFFQNVVPRRIQGFPMVTGRNASTVAISEPIRGGRTRTKSIPTGTAFGLAKQPFVAVDRPPQCSSLARAEPIKGGRFRLSGTDPYNRLVLPVVRAMDQARWLYRDHGSDSILYPRLISGLCVVEAPMLLIEGPRQPLKPVMAPWIRVVRREAVADVKSWRSFQYYAVDVIHAAFVEEYIERHLIPFASAFAEAVAEHQAVLMKGGVVEDVDGTWAWSDVQAKGTRQ